VPSFFVILHLRTFKTPPSGAVMSDEDDADWALKMSNGVKTIYIFLSLRLFARREICENIHNQYRNSKAMILNSNRIYNFVKIGRQGVLAK
jgi:hypothetical protein